ncbi:MAG: hypothetical protein WCG80_13895 [Spirochaetales bacterium]
MKRILWAGLLLVLVVAGAAWWFWGRGPEAVTLAFEHPLAEGKVLQALTEQLREFESLNPGLRVVLQKNGPSADLALLNRYPAEDAWRFPLTPWSGSLWVLAAGHQQLERLAAVDPQGVADLRAGKLDAPGFTALLAKAKSLGSAPLTLGNSHLWPFLLWLQVWTAATLGPDSASRLPGTLAPPYPPFTEAMAELKRWRESGWFDAQAWPLGWAQGVGPLDKGTATFALLSESLLSALSPATRATLEFLPLPHRAGDPTWNLGSAQFLAVSKTSAHSAEAERLVHFLTSPGVTTRLTQATGLPFFAWNTDNGHSPLVLPDWSTLINQPDVQALAQALAN